MDETPLPSSPATPPTRGSRRRRFLLLIGLPLVALFLLYAFYPRKGSFRSFDPKAMATLETTMWRRYYEERFGHLGLLLYTTLRQQYGMRPATSVTVAYHTALAARKFRRSRSRAEAELAIQHLEKAYTLVSKTSSEPFNVKKVAQLELHWWQQRREHVPTEVYALTIADMMKEIYRSDDPRLGECALLRSQMMAYRDERRNGKMTEADWQHIEENLSRAYTLFQSAVSPL